MISVGQRTGLFGSRSFGRSRSGGNSGLGSGCIGCSAFHSLLLRLCLFGIVARLALQQAHGIEKTLDAVGRLCALGQPFFGLFGVQLHWLPAVSTYIPFFEDPLGALENLILPALTLGTYVSGIFARFLRASLLGELKADYVRTARSKGLRERDVVGRHVMRNALLPFVTIVGLMLAAFVGGTVVTEAVFTYPGIGRLLIQAIGVRDYPLIQGCILFVLVIYVLMNVLVDVLYAYIDPRIEYR